jgi:hypothetical protein
MFLKKFGRSVHDVKFTKFTRLPCTRLESVEPWLKANVTMNEKKEATADRNIRFRENSPKQPKNKLCGLNAKSAVT